MEKKELESLAQEIAKYKQIIQYSNNEKLKLQTEDKFIRLYGVAKEIAKHERIIQYNNNEKLKQQAEDEIIRLCGTINNVEDLCVIDELVMKLLEKN